MANVRIRGKIRHEEWPKIAERFQKGETLTEIARSYHCTAPAIRYIVQRFVARGGKGGRMDREKGKVAAILALPTDRRGRRADNDQGGAGRYSGSRAAGIWGRINTDIAMFLAAVDTAAGEDSEANFEALLAATDHLLWASARTRLEVERILAERRKGLAVRRASS